MFRIFRSSHSSVSSKGNTSENPDKTWLERLKNGLKKTSTGLSKLWSSSATLNQEWFEALESALLMSDMGVKTTTQLIHKLQSYAREQGIQEPERLHEALENQLTTLLQPLEKSFELPSSGLHVLMIAGVNGAGKTTSIAKITHHLGRSGFSVLLAAADTFRAAAKEQLTVWADRNWVEVISQQNGDPASVAFDAIQAAQARKKEVVIVDTAGRLPTQTHLMEELKKIKRVITKAQENAPHEVLLVIDGTTGQNALTQVKAFDQALGLTGLIVTKLDGSTKGGIIAAIANECPLPIYFIGVGESLEDLHPFSAREFALALLAKEC